MPVVVGYLPHHEDELWHEVQVLAAQTGDIDAWLCRAVGVCRAVGICNSRFPVVVQINDKIISRPEFSLGSDKDASRFGVNIAARCKKLVRGSDVAEGVVQVDDLEWAF
jgi:hypothetical protein